MELQIVWRSRPFTFLLFVGGGRKGSGVASINYLFPATIVASQSNQPNPTFQARDANWLSSRERNCTTAWCMAEGRFSHCSESVIKSAATRSAKELGYTAMKPKQLEVV